LQVAASDGEQCQRDEGRQQDACGVHGPSRFSFRAARDPEPRRARARPSAATSCRAETAGVLRNGVICV
jgi:hypothetical protein